jgi:hypothetical protein
LLYASLYPSIVLGFLGSDFFFATRSIAMHGLEGFAPALEISGGFIEICHCCFNNQHERSRILYMQ